MRAMMKAYRWITLLWAIPAGWVLALIDGVLRLFLGSTRPLTDLIRASAWNLIQVAIHAARSKLGSGHPGDR
jgi:hypothetical protein